MKHDGKAYILHAAQTNLIIYKNIIIVRMNIRAHNITMVKLKQQSNNNIIFEQ